MSSSTKENQPALHLHEWLAVALLICLLLAVSTINFIQSRSTIEPPHNEITTVEVTIQGAVKNPGTYHFTKGAKMQDLIEKAEPLPHANLKRIKKDAVLKDGKTVRIPQKKAPKQRQEGTEGTKSG